MAWKAVHGAAVALLILCAASTAIAQACVNTVGRSTLPGNSSGLVVYPRNVFIQGCNNSVFGSDQIVIVGNNNIVADNKYDLSYAGQCGNRHTLPTLPDGTNLPCDVYIFINQANGNELRGNKDVRCAYVGMFADKNRIMLNDANYLTDSSSASGNDIERNILNGGGGGTANKPQIKLVYGANGNRILDNKADYIYLESSASDNEVRMNDAAGGIELYDRASKNVIVDNRLERNNANWRYTGSIVVDYEASGNSVIHNNVTASNFQSSIFVEYHANDNHISNNVAGSLTDSSSASNNTMEGNEVDYYLEIWGNHDSSSETANNDTVISNVVGKYLYVGSNADGDIVSFNNVTAGHLKVANDANDNVIERCALRYAYAAARSSNGGTARIASQSIAAMAGAPGGAGAAAALTASALPPLVDALLAQAPLRGGARALCVRRPAATSVTC